METPKEKVIQLINKELEENYELINDEKNYYHDDIQAVKIQINFLVKMLLEVEEIPDPTAQLKADKAELLEALEIFFPMFTELDSEFGIENPPPRKWTETEIATVQKISDYL